MIYPMTIHFTFLIFSFSCLLIMFYFQKLHPYPYSSYLPFRNSFLMLCHCFLVHHSHIVSHRRFLTLCRYCIVCDFGAFVYIKASLAFCKINQEVFSLSLTSKSKSKLKFYKSKFKTGRQLPVVFSSCLRSSPVKSSSHVA